MYSYLFIYLFSRQIFIIISKLVFRKATAKRLCYDNHENYRCDTSKCGKLRCRYNKTAQVHSATKKKKIPWREKYVLFSFHSCFFLTFSSTNIPCLRVSVGRVVYLVWRFRLNSLQKVTFCWCVQFFFLTAVILWSRSAFYSKKCTWCQCHRFIARAERLSLSPNVIVTMQH